MFALLLACQGTGKSPTPFPEGEAVVSSPSVCESGELVPRYADASSEWNFQPFPFEVDQHTNGGGMVVYDFDKDGSYEIVHGFSDGRSYVYAQRDGESHVGYLDGDYSGPMALGDLDGDGEMEVLFGREKVYRYRHTGNLDFERVGTFGPDLSEGLIAAITLLDVNGDGRLDLYLAKDAAVPEPDVLMLQAPNGRFIQWAEFSNGNAFDAAAFDANSDGLLDVMVVNDRGFEIEKNRLYLSNGRTLKPSVDCDCEIPMNAMGVHVGDVDNDGFPDVFISDINDNHLLRGSASGAFLDVSQSMGADFMLPEAMGWGSLLVDVDNDGWQDVFMAQGDLWYEGIEYVEYVGDLPLQVLMQEDGRFTESTDRLGITLEGSLRSVVPADFNDDGVLDFAISDVEKAPKLYLSEACTMNTFTVVEAPLHTEVVIETTNFERAATVQTHSSYGAARPPEVWFGLGGVENLERISFRQPGGDWRQISGPIPTRTRVVIPPQ